MDFYDDILNGATKSVVFGFVVTWIAVFEGYDADPTSEGVSRATTRTVVFASLAVSPTCASSGDVYVVQGMVRALAFRLPRKRAF